MRKRLFLLTLVAGLCLAVVGFLLSAPLGLPSDPMYSEPVIEFAPLIFVLGVITTIMSPVVYELYPRD